MTWARTRGGDAIMKPRRHVSPSMRGSALRSPARLFRYLLEDAVGAVLDLAFEMRDWNRARKGRAARGGRRASR